MEAKERDNSKGNTWLEGEGKQTKKQTKKQDRRGEGTTEPSTDVEGPEQM